MSCLFLRFLCPFPVVVFLFSRPQWASGKVDPPTPHDPFRSLQTACPNTVLAGLSGKFRDSTPD
jgi:hypothetical protein